MTSFSPKLRLIDTQTLQQFAQRKNLEEYRLKKYNSISPKRDVSPNPHYRNGDGYELTWGHILKWRTEPFIVWDFCLNLLLCQYLQKGKRLSDLQKAVFQSWKWGLPLYCLTCCPG